MTISRVLNGLWPVKPTTPPMKADAAMVSTKRAKPSFCSLLYLEVITAFYGAAPNGRHPQKSAGVKSFAQITQGLKPYMGQ